jgi:hypothetical protein
MSTSVEANLSYGFVFPEGFQFPWSSDEFDGDIDAWWRSINGFDNIHEKPYNEEGEYKPGQNSASASVYYDARRKWSNQNPVPVKLVNYCSAEQPMIIIADSDTFEAEWGSPASFNHDDFSQNGADDLKAFLDKYGIKYEGEPQWWLSAYCD